MCAVYVCRLKYILLLLYYVVFVVAVTCGPTELRPILLLLHCCCVPREYTTLYPEMCSTYIFYALKRQILCIPETR